MTDVQKIVSALADCLHDNQISEDECSGVLKALRGIPPEKHMDALKAFLGMDEPEPETQPEDYAVVKTFDSSEFHVGDEVMYFGELAVVLSLRQCFATIIDRNGMDKTVYLSDCHRTGRNFPAIPAILEELKKGVDKSAGTL